MLSMSPMITNSSCLNLKSILIRVVVWFGVIIVRSTKFPDIELHNQTQLSTSFSWDGILHNGVGNTLVAHSLCSTVFLLLCIHTFFDLNGRLIAYYSSSKWIKFDTHSRNLLSSFEGSSIAPLLKSGLNRLRICSSKLVMRFSSTRL